MAKDKRVYDLYFSIGEVCASSATLRASGLQYFSYPFDWTGYASMSEKANMFITNFETFINLEDLEYISYRKSPEPRDIYRNKRNNQEFHHDFPLGVPLSDSYKSVREKYDRRAARLLNDIENSSKVLILYLDRPFAPNPVKDEEFVDFQKKLTERFPNTQIDVLYIKNDESFEENKVIEEDINEHIKKATLNYGNLDKGKEYDAVKGDVLKKYFKRYKLKLSFSNKLRLFAFSAFRAKKLKKGIGLYFLPKIKSNIFRIRALLFGLRIDLCVGKVKE